jgi:putative Mg2+ transporter-C (MgtC) family protein
VLLARQRVPERHHGRPRGRRADERSHTPSLADPSPPARQRPAGRPPWWGDGGGHGGGAVIETGSVSHLEAVVRLAAAAGFGAVIGFEREVDGHEAGVRTHSLLALGAALFGLLSVSAFSDFVAARNDTNVTIDVSRIASYIPAGIGFLGGGVILKRQNRVKGLTTAASLWVVSAVGLAAGLGAWLAACVATALCLAGLLAERPLARLMARLRGHDGHLRVEVEAESSAETLGALCDLVGARGRVTRVERSDDGGLLVDVRAGPRSPSAIGELATTVAALPGVRAVEDVSSTRD